MYIYSQTLSNRAQDSMSKHNMSFSKDGGMKVGVKEKTAEDYSSGIQRGLVDTWNKSTMPDYKSRLWNKDAEINKRPGSAARGASGSGG